MLQIRISFLPLFLPLPLPFLGCACLFSRADYSTLATPHHFNGLSRVRFPDTAGWKPRLIHCWRLTMEGSHPASWGAPALTPGSLFLCYLFNPMPTTSASHIYPGIITKKFLQWKDQEPDYTWFERGKNLLFNRLAMKKIESVGAELRVLRAGGEWGRKASVITAIVFLKHWKQDMFQHLL